MSAVLNIACREQTCGGSCCMLKILRLPRGPSSGATGVQLTPLA